MTKTIDTLSSFPVKTAFITGAGSGLGAEFAKVLSANHWNLILVDVDKASLDQVALLANTDTNSIQTFTLDVSDYKQYDQLVNELDKQGFSIDLLINNAGIGDGNLFIDYAHDEWMKMLRINLIGVYHGCKILLPHLLNQPKAQIINIGSAAGFMNAPGMSAYNVTKAGVYALSETLYHELKHLKVHVSVATPTFFKTNIMKQAKGRRSMVDFAKDQMNQSTTNAEETAIKILSKATEGAFQIKWPGEAKKHYFIKKWFPKLIERQFEKLFQHLT